MKRRHAASNPADGARTSRGGFALVEVIVALAVMAVLAGVIPRALVSAREAARQTEAWHQSAMLAQLLLAERTSGPALRAGTTRGEASGRKWSVTVAPRSGSAATARPLLDVRIDVEVSGGRMLTVETVRVGGRP